MKTEWLVTNMTAIGFPARAESEFFGVVLDVFWPIRAAFVVGEPLCELEMSSLVCVCVTGLLGGGTCQ